MVREEVLADIRVGLASRAAEELFLGTQMTGVISDLSQATRMAAAYVGIWGMGGSLYSNLAFGQGVPDPQQKKQIEELLSSEYEYVKRLIKQQEAAVHAIADALIEREELDKDEIHEIIQSQPGKAMREEDRTRLAYHEAGHCVASYLLLPGEPVEKVSIIPDSSYSGFNRRAFDVRYTRSREEYLALIQVKLASRAAERLFLGTELDGVAGDLAQATELAISYFDRWGMGGSLVATKDSGTHKREQLDKLLEDQYQKVARLLTEYAATVKSVAEALTEKSELEEDEIRSIVEGTRPGGGSVAAH